MTRLTTLAWPRDRLAEAVAELAHAAGVLTAARAAPPVPAPEHPRPGPAIAQAAARLGVEAREVETDLASLPRALAAMPPALMSLETEDGERFLAVVGAYGRRLSVVTPDGARRSVPIAQVERSFRPDSRPTDARTGELFDVIERAAGRPLGARQAAITSELLGSTRVRGLWILEGRSRTSSHGARDVGLGRHARRFLFAHVAQYALWIALWWIVSGLAPRANFGAPDLSSLALVLATLVLCRAAEGHAARMTALGAGTLIKRGLLIAALDLGRDEVQHQGVGHYLGRVLEAEAIDTAGLSGAFLGGSALIGSLVATLLLWSGAGGFPHALLFLVCAAAMLALSAMYYARRRRWTELRLALTALGVEQMQGHQTRLAQQDPALRHAEDDRLLERHLAAQATLDGAAAACELVRRGWMYVGLIGMAGAFAGGTPAPSALLASVGGVVVGWQAFSNWTQAQPRLAAAVIALAALRRFWSAPDPGPQNGSETLHQRTGAGAAADRDATPVLEARQLSFTHQASREPLIRRASFSFSRDERILVEGPSGSGKSTLAAILAGLRRPDSGLLLLEGLDHATLGRERWRRAVVLAPQFQDNHLLAGTLAYNLLLGRRWPPTRSDLDEAETACRELGLGPLIERMPLGLHQPVGETGWQPSHGERSRVFAARALLQKPALLVLDESFAALDPATLAQTLRHVIAQPGALLMIAHP